MTSSSKKPIIVLDGPAGAGKSTVAREVAKRLRLPFLDTGAIYRAISYVMVKDGIPPQDSPALDRKLREFKIEFQDNRVIANSEDVTRQIRTPEMDIAVSPYSAMKSVRDSLVEVQRSCATAAGLVAEGRDMGTVIFPDADLKIFLTATPEARAMRRYRERMAKGETADYDEILESVNRRDRVDSSRDVAPLKPADDAIYFDTTDYTFEEVVEKIVAQAAEVRSSGDR